jgi:hypothetical protein
MFQHPVRTRGCQDDKGIGPREGVFALTVRRFRREHSESGTEMKTQPSSFLGHKLDLIKHFRPIVAVSKQIFVLTPQLDHEGAVARVHCKTHVDLHDPVHVGKLEA